ncbi:hypothetical protein TNCV_3526421 [Trichonephila clavipes]|nr:hypothetical protein TNCV_3526421 [Trichonephila clavipes]
MFMVLETWVRRGGRDFGGDGPMGVQETSVVEGIFDWRMESGQKRMFHSWAGGIWDILYNMPSDRSPGS